MLFRINLIGNLTDLYIKIFACTNYGGTYKDIKIDFSTLTSNDNLTFEQEIQQELEDKDFSPKYNFAYPLFFISPTKEITKKEIYCILKYVFYKIYDDTIEYPSFSLCYKIKQAIKNLEKNYNFKNKNIFVLYTSYCTAFIGYLVFDKNKIYHDYFIYNSEKVCFTKDHSKNSPPLFSSTYTLEDLSKYVENDELKLPDNKLFEILHIAKIY